MRLTHEQTTNLERAMCCYSYPFVTWDCKNHQERVHDGMTGVEKVIHEQLTSGDSTIVKGGLLNVLYWGYATTGFRDFRVKEFEDKVTTPQLNKVIGLFREPRSVCPSGMGDFGIPQFSGVSFISKALMFLDPRRFVVLLRNNRCFCHDHAGLRPGGELDSKIASLRQVRSGTLFDGLTATTTIRASRGNDTVYEAWCRFCVQVGEELGVRAVDVERGIFQMVQWGMRKHAADICARPRD